MGALRFRLFISVSNRRNSAGIFGQRKMMAHARLRMVGCGVNIVSTSPERSASIAGAIFAAAYFYLLSFGSNNCKHREWKIRILSETCEYRPAVENRLDA